MAESVEEALQEAIAELEAKELVKEVYYFDNRDKDLPGKWIEKQLAVLHRVRGQTGYTWSTKSVYIKDEAPYEYLFQHGGPQETDIVTSTREYFLSKLDTIKQAKDFDFIKIESVDEDTKSAVLYAIKEKSDKYARIYRAQCWRTGETTFDYQIIEITDIEIPESL